MFLTKIAGKIAGSGLGKAGKKVGQALGKVADKLPAPGHTIIGDALAKRRAKPPVGKTLPPLPGGAKSMKIGPLYPGK